jgi:hypothetical protein
MTGFQYPIDARPPDAERFGIGCDAETLRV